MKKITYSELNSRQKENYNFHKISAVLADYGFSCIRLTDDWQGADFIANHIDGKTFLKVQLKGRLSFDKKYQNKDIWVCFPYKDNWYLYPHDIAFKELKKIVNWHKSDSWIKHGGYTSGQPGKVILSAIKKYQLCF